MLFVRVLFLVVVVKGVASLNKQPLQHVLVNDLFKNYDSNVPPIFHKSKSVNFKLQFDLLQIIDLDEKNQVLTTLVRLKQVFFCC